MTPPLSARDLELLSAYLDERLGPRERAALENRLQSDAGLRRELEQLRATVQALRGLPVLQPPRSYTLPVPAPSKAREISRRPITPLEPRLRWATALASIAFAVVVGADLVVHGPLPAAQAPAQEAPVPLYAEATTAAVSEDASEAQDGAGPAASSQIDWWRVLETSLAAIVVGVSLTWWKIRRLAGR